MGLNGTDRPEPQLRETELRPEALMQGQAEAFARDVERLRLRLPEFVDTACPACGGADREPAFTGFGFAYASCLDCRTLYMNPRPSPRIMGEYYSDSENYRYWAEHIFPASEDARREKIHRPRLERIVEYCRRYGVAGDTLIEVGPGFGTFAALARDSGAFGRVLAVERTPEMAQSCRDRGLEVLECGVEEVGESLAADVAVSFEVVEHLFAPRDFVAKFSRILRPGGLLVLTCPNGLGFEVAELGGAAPAVDPEHVNLFNPDSLRRMVEECGFEFLESSTPGKLDAELVRKAMLDGRHVGGPFLRRVLLDEWERLGGPFQQFLAGHGLSSHMWLVARRPLAG
jgi:SAM-dependent methyltransferase